jgi:hypothetical protein
MTYKSIQSILYVIDTGPDDNGSGKTYLGLPDPLEDIDARCQLMLRAMQTASANLPQTSPPEAPGTTLKVFMAPAFFFRGGNGAYDMDSVQYAVAQLQKMSAGDEWTDWLLVFGTIAGFSDTSGQAYPGGAPIAGQPEMYNFTLVQRGGAANAGPLSAKVVMKEIMSGIDFIADVANSGGLLLGEVDHGEAGPVLPGGERQLVDYDGAGVLTLDDITWGLDIRDHLRNSPQLPGESLIQAQLIPSYGMAINPAQVAAEQQGYVFLCDGSGLDSSAMQVGSAGTPAVTTLTPIAQLGAFAVPDTPLESDQSPPQPIAIDQLYANGAGSIDIYAAQPVPPAATVPGSTVVLSWPATENYQFDFSLIYDDAGRYQTTLCRVISSNPNFKDLNYFLPLGLQTSDASGGTVLINVKNRPGSGGYDHAVWCSINLPGFVFQGVAFECYDDSARGLPYSCW